MKQVTPWSLLVAFVGLPVLLVGINEQIPDSPSAPATDVAITLFDALGSWMGVIFLLVAVAIVAGWSFSYDGGGF